MKCLILFSYASKNSQKFTLSHQRCFPVVGFRLVYNCHLPLKAEPSQQSTRQLDDDQNEEVYIHVSSQIFYVQTQSKVHQCVDKPKNIEEKNNEYIEQKRRQKFETKIDAESNCFPSVIWENWGTNGKHVHSTNVSGNKFLRFFRTLSNEHINEQANI